MTPTSDYDFIVVIEDGVLPVIELNEVKANGTNAIDKKFIVLEEGLVNATLIAFHDWRVCLYQHYHECLEVHFTPRSKYLLLCDRVSALHDAFVLDLDMLRRTAAWESKRRYTRAVYPARDSMRRGKKDLVHALRYLLFALQIIAHGKIVDFTCANQIYKEIVVDTENSVTDEVQFKELMKTWETKRSQLSHQLADARVSRRFYGRGDTERRFLQLARAKSKFDVHALDATKFERLITSVEEEKIVDEDLKAIREALKSVKGDINVIQDAFQITYLRHEANPKILIVCPQRVIQDYTKVPFIKAIANGIVLIQNVEQQGDYKLLSFGLPFLPSSASLDPQTRLVWNEELEKSDASERFVAEEHMDGTHVTMFFVEGEWQICSRIEPMNPSMKLSFVPINNVDSEIDVNTAFWRVWKQRGYRLPDASLLADVPIHDMCFTFNLIVQEHRYLVNYTTEDVVLVHARNVQNGESFNHRFLASLLQWSVPPTLNPLPRSLEQLERASFLLNPLERKGYVLKTFGGPSELKLASPLKAVTVKNPIYVSIRYGTDPETIGQLNMRVEVDRKLLHDQAVYSTGPRFIEVHTHWKTLFDQVTHAYTQFCELLDAEYRPHWRKPRKEFVASVDAFPYCQVLFRMYHNRFPCAKEHFALLPSKHHLMYKPWRQYLRKSHQALFTFFQGEEEEGDGDVDIAATSSNETHPKSKPKKDSK